MAKKKTETTTTTETTETKEVKHRNYTLLIQPPASETGVFLTIRIPMGSSRKMALQIRDSVRQNPEWLSEVILPPAKERIID